MTCRAHLVALRAFHALDVAQRDLIAAQQRIDERALFLREHRAISAADAAVLALFTLSTWAQRYPVPAHDLGDGAALFFVDWLAARHVEPTEDRLREALDEWRARKAFGSLSQ